jgi:hypothetical protein
MLVIAISFFSSLSQSIVSPFVKTLIATFVIAYAVLPRKNREYIRGLTTIIRPFQSLALKYGSEDWTEAYKPSELADCMSWYHFVGVFSTDAHYMAPGL